MVVVNLQGVKVGFENLPDGTYPARLTKTTFKPSKSNPKNQNANLEFVFNEEAGEPVAGRKAFVTLPTSERGLGITKGALINLGVDPEELEGPVNLAEIFEELAGTDAWIRVTKETYQNEERDRYHIVEEPNDWTS